MSQPKKRNPFTKNKPRITKYEGGQTWAYWDGPIEEFDGFSMRKFRLKILAPKSQLK